MLFEASALDRIGALLLVLILVILGLTWGGLMLNGQWIASKNVLSFMFLIALLLMAMVAQQARR